ncbi:MAG: tRNA lysidine(34) synthetase TilS [Dechloromonas sp.]|nr:MAG: tRNA lysidine(34) synthetase TilS [Dechloromonas sp.]
MAASRNSLRSSLPARVAAFLATRTTPGENVCVGLSGGCDSVVLLHVLAVLGPRERLRAVHVHHGLSANADRWAAFCTDYCRGLGIDLLVERVEVDRHTGLGLEAAAREARYRAFSGSAGGLLLLGHHRGDQAETLLFNLLRGAGVAGAAGIPAERREHRLRILRPLLDVSRDEIEAYARDHRLDWVDDESNCDTALSRNFLRHRVLTVLAGRFAAAEMNLVRAAGRFAEADVLLGELARIDWQAAADGDALKLAKLRELSAPRLKNLLRFRLRQLGWHAPAAARLDEFSRQLLTAGADRHPALHLAEGSMVAGGGVLRWIARG